jgi:hypothetical protein
MAIGVELEGGLRMNKRFTFKETVSSDDQYQDMTVILGALTIKAFVSAPRDYKALGIVRFGCEFGLLAMTQHGNYFRVNGSEIQPLFKRDVQEAIQKAKRSGPGAPFKNSRPAELEARPAPSPTVVKKRHRTIDPELAANNSQLQPLAA